jgi:hypothetical protein
MEGRMRGCLRKLGILLGILVVLAVAIALVFWLNWRRKNQLYSQAWDSYYDCNPADALAAYQEYLQVFGLDEREVRYAQSEIDELEGYLNAYRLQQEGQLDEAISAYATFLDDHNAWKDGYTPYVTPYYFLAGQALVSLKTQQAEQYHKSSDFGKAIEVYAAVLSLKPLVDGDCSQFDNRVATIERLCRETEIAMNEKRVAALDAVPAVMLDWSEALDQGENYLEFIKSCEKILEDFPEILHASDIAAVQAAVDKAHADLPGWLQANPAVPRLEFSEEVTRDYKGVWILTTVFREVGGKVGYTLEGSGWIIDEQGEKWGIWGLSEISRGPVTVPVGGEAENTYRLEGDSFVNGFAVFTWEGMDEGGHQITFEERVHLLP